MKSFKKLLSFILVFSLIASTIPFGILADSNASLGLQSSLEQTNTTSDNNAEILYELVDKRDAVTKHFLMSDGTIKAYVYPEAVHYKEGEEFLEIDNSLVETKVRGKGYYQNKANSFKANLPQNSEDYVEFSDENGYVKFKLVGALNSAIKKQEATLSRSSDKTVLQNKHSRAVYKSVKADIDIQYDIIGNKLKETIILNKNSKQSYVFEILTSASSAVKNQDNSISFYNAEGKEIYTIESPYMQDSEGELSYAIETILQKTDNGYTLTYNPDYNWLSSKDRVYPVYIDPTITTSDMPEIVDTYIDSSQSSGSSANGQLGYVRVGAYSVNGIRLFRRAYYKFEMPTEISANDIILDAHLILVHSEAEQTNNMPLDLYNVTSSWSEGSLIWTNQPTHDTAIAAITNVSTENGYDVFDITKLAKGWHNRSIDNNGVMIEYRNEYEDTAYAHVEYDANVTSEGNYTQFTSAVQITYRCAVGLENYWSYSSVGLSEYGAGYLNNYSGAMTFVAPITSMSTNTGSLALSLIYNAGYARWVTATNKNPYSICGLYGNGWRLNLVQTVKDYTQSNSAHEYIYTDGDGTEHYFIKTDNDEIKDEDGLGLTITPLNETVDNGSTHLTIQITSTDKTVMKFDDSGYLRRIIDANGNTTSLNYSPADSYSQCYLTSATLPSGKGIQLVYEVVGAHRRLQKVIDFSQKQIYISYNEENLSRINYPAEESAITNFSYDRAKLVKAEMPDGISINFTYKLKNPLKSDTSHYTIADSIYSTYKDSTNTLVTGDGYTLEYNESKTVVTHTSGRKITYQFDTAGRTTGVYDDQGNICTSYYNPDSTDASEIFKNNKLSAGSYVFRYAENLLKNPTFANSLGNWTVWGEGYYSATASTHTGIMDNDVAEITVNNIASDAGIKQTPVTRSNREYTLSAYVFPVNVVSANRGAALEVVTTEGRTLYSDFITGTSTTEKTNKGYKQLNLTFTLNAGETISYVAVGLYNATGKIYVDALQLEVGNTVNPINLIENSSFEETSLANSTAFHGSKSIRLGNGVIPTDANRCIVEDDLSGKKGDVFVLGCALNMNFASEETEDLNQKVGMEIIFGGDENVSYYVDINPYASGWHWVSKAVIAPFDYSRVRVIIRFSTSVNYAYFDSVFLYKDIAECYTYDSDGNVISSYDFAEGEKSFNYQNGNITKLVSPNGSAYEYYYSDDKLLSANSASGVGYRFGYDLQSTNPSPEIAHAQADRYSSSIQKGKTYYIRSKPSGKNMQTFTGSFSEGNNIITYVSSGISSQKWVLQDAGDGYFYIESAGSDYRLGVRGGSATQNQAIELTLNSGDKTKFKIIPDNSGIYYYIIPKLNSDMVLCKNAGALNGSDQIVLAPLSENREDKYWYFIEAKTPENLYYSATPQNNEIYFIRFYHNFYYMDIPAMQSAEGTPVTQHPLNAGVNQQFRLKATSNGYFKIVAMHTASELLFTLVPNSNGTGSIQLFADNGTAYQEFKFIEGPGESYRIVCKASSSDSYAIEISGAGYNYSEPLSYSTCSGYGEAHQRVVLEDAGDIIRTSATYTEDLDFISSVTDSRGNTTSYTYNADGSVNTATDAKGNKLFYVYNENGSVRIVRDEDESYLIYYSYHNNSSRVSRIWGNTVDYRITYDNYGRKTKIQNYTGSTPVLFSLIAYKDNYSTLISRIEYGNGTEIVRFYDNYDRLESEWIDSQLAKTYTYDSYNRVLSYTDHLTGITETYTYDLAGRVFKVKSSDGNIIVYDYDRYNRLENTEYTLNGNEFSYSYTYGDSEQGQKSDLFYGFKLNGNDSITYTYDNLNRIKTKTIHTDTPFVIEYTYYDGAVAGTTSELIKTVKIGNVTYEYTYDEVGNIVAVYESGDRINYYEYDKLNQLTYELDIVFGSSLRNYGYTYDGGGNINKVYENDELAANYTYGNSNWKDQLTQYKGQSITYDSIGNPLNYRDGYVFNWTQGRRLSAITKNGSAVANYTYDSDGLRRSKTVNGVTTEYNWFGGILQYQKTGSEYIYYLYDESGMPYGILVKNGAQENYYYYIYNLQGEIIKIVDQSGAVVVEYAYNAWGEILATRGTLASTLGQTNPIRYKGYYYDTETRLYYLNSRYYDPIVRRFVNADSYNSTGQGFTGNNMFAYCGNNPVIRFDKSGYEPVSVIVDSILSGSSEFSVIDLVIAKKTELKQSQLESMGFKNIDYNSAEKYMTTIRGNNINTKELEAHFLAQCAAETNFGLWLTERGDAEYFNKNGYGTKYRGAGYIQLTWDSNYSNFATAMGDSEIYNQGAEYVAKHYAWQSAGWFWSNKNMNGRIANGETVKDITRVVRGTSSGWEQRQEYYNRFIVILS